MHITSSTPSAMAPTARSVILALTLTAVSASFLTFWTSPSAVGKALPTKLKSSLAVLLDAVVQSVSSVRESLIDDDEARAKPKSNSRSVNFQEAQEDEVSVPTGQYDPCDISIDEESESEYTQEEEDEEDGDEEGEEEENEATAQIRANQRNIQAVLRYWFGQYAPDQAAKKLWMVSAQNSMWRQQMDQEITEQFGQILFELTAVTDETWNQWCYDSEIYGFAGKIAAIVILDQFSRHIVHYQKEMTEAERTSEDLYFLQLLPPQMAMDRMAFKTSQLFIDEHAMEIASGMIPLPMFIFSLMPFRHAKILETVEYVQMQIEGASELHEQNYTMLRRFRKSTNRRMALIQDVSRRTGTGQTDFPDRAILEHVAFSPSNMGEAVGHPVHKAIRGFLEEQGIHMVQEGAIHGGHPATPMIISLSGSAESMVAASVCSHIVESGKYRISLEAVHVDYANRPESAAEAAYLEVYCKKLGIHLHSRRIDEASSNESDQTARFDLYQQVVKECQNKSGAEQVGVVLGHHRGDLRETLLSNANTGGGPLELSGLTAVSKNDGVTLYRPLLTLEKTDIIEYAHKFGVPFFKDSTPNWSTRAKLRSKLLPLLEEIYGEGSMENLSHLAVESDECRVLVQNTIVTPFLDQVGYGPMGISFDTTAYKTQGHFFWKFVLKEAMRSVNMEAFTDKSVEAFMERVQADKIKQGWLQCRKDCGVYLHQDGKVFILQPETFPVRAVDAYPTAGQSVGFGPDNATMIGPWHVSAVVVAKDKATKATLSQAAVHGVQGLMEGSVEYYLQVPMWETTSNDGSSYEPRPLIVATFTKASRPLALKNVDIKIQDILPLLGNDDECVHALNDSVENPVAVVKVSLRATSDCTSTEY